MQQKAILFDRDGVLIADPPDKRVDSTEKVSIFPESIDALSKIAKSGYLCFIITNQAGIGEGLITEAEFHTINDRMYQLLEPSDIKFEKLYFSVDTQDSNSHRRKPNTGMFEELVAEYDIDTENSFMIGDRDTDVEFGTRCGLKTILMDRQDDLSFAHVNSSSPTHIAKDLNEVASIVQNT